jgi:uncharacterized protein YndB with AHSA1/START domain
MKTPDYRYVTVIAATPEKVWKGLTTAEFTRQYWHSTRVRSDWQQGSKVEFLVENDAIGCEGVILEVEPPARLSYTWRFPQNPETANETPSRVTFILEPVTGGTQLTVIHDQFPDDSVMYQHVSAGWPLVIAGLKTLLETGAAVDFTAAAA